MELTRIYSASFMDDQSVYTHEDDGAMEQKEEAEEALDQSETTGESTVTAESAPDVAEKDFEKRESRRSRRSSEISDEVRMGIRTERDIEPGVPLEKKTTTRDPNLVRFQLATTDSLSRLLTFAGNLGWT